MKFGERLKQIRIEKGMSQDSLAAMLGTSKQVISRYETGQRTPKINIANEYAKKLGVPLDYLLGDDSVKQTRDIYGLLPIESRRIPLLGEIACGQPVYAEEHFEHYIECGTEIKADFALRCKGDSMINARILDGDVVFIRKQPMVDNRDIAAVLIEDEATLKRVYISKDGITLVAENPAYEPIFVSKKDSKNVRILGKAVAFQSDIR